MFYPFSQTCVKHFILVFNIMFTIIGVVLITTGALAYKKIHGYTEFVPDLITKHSLLLIIMGSVLFLTSFLGGVGAITKNTYLLIMFGILLISITIFEVGMVIFFQFKRNYLDDEFDQSPNNSLKMSRSNRKYRETWDFLQNTFKCCGKNSTEDWTPMITNDYLPVSCFQKPVNSSEICTRETASPIGCETMLIELFYKILTIFVQVGFIVCIFQLITIALMFWLYGDLHRLSAIEAENARNANNVDVSDLIFRLMTNNKIMKF